MLKWEIPTSDEPPFKAAKCKLNPGVLDSFGDQIPHPSRIWVENDTLTTAVGIFRMKMVFTAVIEAILIVTDEPNTRL